MKIIKPKILSQFKTWLNKTEESDLKIKIISFSIAFLLHLALILYLRQAKILIKILPFGRETDVVIATYPRLSLPANLEEVINQPPVADDLFHPDQARGQLPAVRAGQARVRGRPSTRRGSWGRSQG